MAPSVLLKTPQRTYVDPANGIEPLIVGVVWVFLGVRDNAATDQQRTRRRHPAQRELQSSSYTRPTLAQWA
jgi:hypothetical protein